MKNQNKIRELGNKERAIDIKDLVLSCLDRDKAEDVTLIDLEGKADFAHFMVVASGRSTRHVNSLAEKILADIKNEGFGGVGVEGMKEGNWVLIDALDVVIHIFIPEVRENYSIEKMWNFTLPAERTEA
ncbi:ribosome silencing factor [Holosporaceae bacterium 'Namur']|nr:ribosome silencing factor [Holosporaceae bacterium 'Namur']